ncbi:MAG: efflux transporter outer membrane subunit [Betaproteobacteria bacterium]|nr:efflux transporter outer membrane subunit [Betaproteobacteria bacterium]
MRRALVAALLCGLLSGCLVGPDYVKPKVDTPAKFLYEPKEVADTANTEWWKQFGDPVLDELIAEALANNRNVQIAAANVEQAAGLLTQTRAPLFPQFNYDASAGRYGFSNSSTVALPRGVSNPTNVFTVGAGVSWEIDLWGRIRRQTEAAQANLLASNEARRGVVLTLVSQIATTYIELRALDEQLVIAQRTLKSYDESLTLIKDKFEFGQVSQMNVAQAQSRYESAATEIPNIRRQIAITENALSILLARNPGQIPRGKNIYELTLVTVPAGLPSDLLEQRPDILQAEQQLIAANAQIGAAKALYFPTISLTGNFGYASTDLGDLFQGSSRAWNFAGSVVGPIFTAGAISGQVAQTEAVQKAALLKYQQTIQNAFADVDNALVSRQERGDQLAAQERLVTALKEYEELAKLLWDGGYAPYSTVLQAQEELFPQELNLAVTRATLLSSTVDIYRATGGGWVNEADKLAPQPVAGSGWFAPTLPSDQPPSQAATTSQ